MAKGRYTAFLETDLTVQLGAGVWRKRNLRQQPVPKTGQTSCPVLLLKQKENRQCPFCCFPFTGLLGYAGCW